MVKKTSNYSISSDRRKKIIYVIVLIALSLALLGGIAAAYFSDFIKKSSSMTTNTLKINATYDYYYNNVLMDAEDIPNLNPGDIIVIKGTVTNIGNQSAWLREKIEFNEVSEDLLPFLKVYSGEYTQTEVKTEDLTESELSMQNGFAVGLNKVIDGSDESASAAGGSYNYLNSTTYSFSITVYFSHNATNAAQNKTFSLSVVSQALQFVNNNAIEPDETVWAGVAS